jgi:quercetin dioxygenase-like cupin family protein
MRTYLLGLLLTLCVAAPGLLLADSPSPKDAPVLALFIDAASSKKVGICDTVVLAVARGGVTIFDERLGPGDVLIASGTEEVNPKGDGLAALAVVPFEPCVPKSAPAFIKRVVRASEAHELTWAGGAMHAHLDVEKDKLPELYVGRLEGTAPVAEHAHDKSWEFLFVLEAKGTLTLDGKPQRVESRSVVQIPPGAKHAWTPDPGSKLVAIQMYSPPGPEQRFKALADAGK